MTEFDSHTLPTTPGLRAQHLTIYRDTPLPNLPTQVVRLPRSSVRALVQPDQRASGGLFLGLIAVTLPAVAYSLMQAWHLCVGGSLDHAIRAFMP